MKPLIAGLILILGFSIFAVPPKEKNLEKYASYKVISIGSGPIINVEKTLAVPNQKKMGAKDITKEQIEINFYTSGGIDDMDSAKKFLADTIGGKKIKVVDGRTTFEGSTTVQNGISIIGTKNREFKPHKDIVLPDGKYLSDIYLEWLDERAKKKAK
jgi:hypothetical protein